MSIDWQRCNRMLAKSAKADLEERCERGGARLRLELVLWIIGECA